MTQRARLKLPIVDCRLPICFRTVLRIGNWQSAIGNSKVLLLFVVGLSVMGCSARLPGQPSEADRWRAPAEITDFNQLYTQNCAGCHGAGGRVGAARPLNDPLYLAFVTDDALRHAISTGRDGTSMPAFSEQAGGHLKDQQIELIVSGMRRDWSRPDDFKGVDLPHYNVNETATTNGPTGPVNNSISARTLQTGDAPRGFATYKTFCSSCHGTNGEGVGAGTSIV